MKIKDYKIIRDNAHLISSEIVNHIDEGWQLYGSPFISNGNVVCQAMVFLESDENKNEKENN